MDNIYEINQAWQLGINLSYALCLQFIAITDFARPDLLNRAKKVCVCESISVLELMLHKHGALSMVLKSINVINLKFHCLFECNKTLLCLAPRCAGCEIPATEATVC